jgi:cyanobactin maturation PatA/PatG family protease
MKLPHGLPPRPSVVPLRPAAIGASGLHLAEAAAEARAAPPAAPALAVGALIYAIGTLDYTFANGARRDLVVQEMLPGTPALRHDLVTYLAAHPAQAEWLTWTINVDAIPIYALRPAPAFGQVLYAQLRQWLGQFPEGTHIHLSVPGVITGTTRLLSGAVVPVLQPALHGLYCWSPEVLLRQFMLDSKLDANEQRQIDEQIDKFQQRVYAELRNRGATPHERALNYAATEAFQLLYVQMGDPTARLVIQDLELSEVVAAASPLCRPDSAPHCWDVELRFFDPDAHLTRPRHVYRFTVDVSGVLPVTIGDHGEWEYA